jgi:hypothetical protein
MIFVVFGGLFLKIHIKKAQHKTNHLGRQRFSMLKTCGKVWAKCG